MKTNEMLRAAFTIIIIFMLFNLGKYLVSPGWSLWLLVLASGVGYLATWFYVLNKTQPDTKFPSTVRSRINAGLKRSTSA